MNKQTRTTLSFLSGLAIGAALGILFAPQKGTKTRTLIVDKARSLKDRSRRQLVRTKAVDHSDEDVHYAV